MTTSLNPKSASLPCEKIRSSKHGWIEGWIGCKETPAWHTCWLLVPDLDTRFGTLSCLFRGSVGCAPASTAAMAATQPCMLHGRVRSISLKVGTTGRVVLHSWRRSRQRGTLRELCVAVSSHTVKMYKYQAHTSTTFVRLLMSSTRGHLVDVKGQHAAQQGRLNHRASACLDQSRRSPCPCPSCLRLPVCSIPLHLRNSLCWPATPRPKPKSKSSVSLCSLAS